MNLFKKLILIIRVFITRLFICKTKQKMKIKAIIFGATGMVGEGVLHETLKYPEVESVLVINRRPCGIEHEELIEIIHQDFPNYVCTLQQLGLAMIYSVIKGWDAQVLECTDIRSLAEKGI